MTILVTGGAGFIGSHIVDALLNDERVKKVRVIDNLLTGSYDNIRHHEQNPQFEFIKADIREASACEAACNGVDLVCHQAALGSVPRSINDPLTTNDININGTLNVFNAARAAGIKRVVYAASSSTYGDHPGLPKVEDKIGNPLSPYAVTKLVNEQYARVFGNLYGMEMIGLRYFNIFGPRQSPKGPYAAVIPLFIQAFFADQAPRINGDGSFSRDFTYVANAVQANLKALFTDSKEAVNQVYNIACGNTTSLLQMVEALQQTTGKAIQAEHGPTRIGDIPHSLADIQKAARYLNYYPEVQFQEGLQKTYEWFVQQVQSITLPLAH
jgi:UDP-N-acetylglucosamine 4-epimerase